MDASIRQTKVNRKGKMDNTSESKKRKATETIKLESQVLLDVFKTVPEVTRFASAKSKALHFFN